MDLEAVTPVACRSTVMVSPSRTWMPATSGARSPLVLEVVMARAGVSTEPMTGRSVVRPPMWGSRTAVREAGLRATLGV